MRSRVERRDFDPMALWWLEWWAFNQRTTYELAGLTQVKIPASACP